MSHLTSNDKYEAAYDLKFPVARAALYLNVSLATTWRLIWAGKLKSYQVAGRTFIGISHIQAYLKASEERNLRVKGNKD